MKKSRNFILLAVVLITGLWATLELRIYASSYLGIGPDVIVGDIPSIVRWGSQGDQASFSIGTTSCNIGDTRMDWISSTNVHPVISQNLYRVKDGRIEQLGMSWLKHGFAVAAGSYCSQCTDPSGVYLGVGCSDPYSAGLNGSHGRLGPRNEINAATGYFPMPHGVLPSQGVLDGRIRVSNSELDPAENSDARYFVESQYIHPQDAAAGNDNNNASYREAFVSATGNDFYLNTSSQSPTVRQKPAIFAWQAIYPDVEVFPIDVPNDGRLMLGIRITPTPNGYHTEIAIENLTSHRSLRALGVLFESDAISNPGFNDVDYQYEPYSGNDWAPFITGNEIQWATESYDTNENANALRWSTIYSYWCDSATRPTRLTLGLFRPGTPTEIAIDISGAVVPESFEVTRGTTVAGGVFELTESDDADLTIQRTATDIQAQTEFGIKSSSPIANPAILEVTLEGAVFARSRVDQSIELYNYPARVWEPIDTRAATTFTDSSVTVAASGDLSRFVEPGTMCVEARIRYQSPVARQQFSSNTDQFIWTIE